MELGFPVNFPTNLPPKWRHLPPQKWRFFKVDTTGFEVSMAEPSGNDGTLEANFSITFLVICGHNSDKFVNFLHHVHLCSLFILIYLGFVWESLKRRLKLIQGGPQNSEPRISWRQNLRETLIFFWGKTLENPGKPIKTTVSERLSQQNQSVDTWCHWFLTHLSLWWHWNWNGFCVQILLLNIHMLRCGMFPKQDLLSRMHCKVIVHVNSRDSIAQGSISM